MKKIIVVVLLAGLLSACTAVPLSVGLSKKNVKQAEVVDVEKTQTFENENYKLYVDTKNIKKDVESIDVKFKGHFDKYIQYVASNGRPITIVAQDKVSNEQLLKAYNILSFYLTSHKSYDMTSVANQMASNGAILMMPNGADGDKQLKESVFYGQPLYQMEVPVTGDAWYINNNYEHRDASYEEILHLVHDGGIGTMSSKGVLPKLQQTIEKSMKNALPTEKSKWGKSGLWGLNSKDWLVELSREGSLEQEYIVSVVDSYYGLWEAFKDSDGGMWGLYIAKDRAAVKEKDPSGYGTLESFLPKNFTYMDRVSPTFEGTFSIQLDPAQSYTYKSQYIDKVRLTGKLNSNLFGNERDNIFIGNGGNNIINGGEGRDIVQFSGASGDYVISQGRIEDTKGRDGIDTLKNIEVLRFTDKDILVTQGE